jgi:competence CoiA-like predicted nuclease
MEFKNLIKKLPDFLVEQEIYKRVHQLYLNEIFEELKETVRNIACDNRIIEGHILQELYLSKNTDLYYNTRYNLLYYDCIETNSGFEDHESCKNYALNWNEELDDYFSVYEDLPMLESDIEELDDYQDLDEFDY